MGNRTSAPANLPGWLPWLIGLPVVLFVLTWILLASLFPPPRVRAIVQAQLQRVFAREVRFSDASLAILPAVRLAVQQPALADSGGFAEGTAFAARELDLELDVFALLRRQIKVDKLVLAEPTLHLVLRTDGSTNLDHLGASQKPGAPPPAMDLNITSFAVRGGRVLIDDLGARRRTAFSLATTTRLSARQGQRLFATDGVTDVSDLAFGPLSARRLTDLDRSLAKLVFRLEHRGKFETRTKRLALEQLALSLGQTRLSLTGIVDDPGPHARFDLRATGEALDLAQVLSWVSVADARAVKGLAGSGRLSFDLTARGAGPAPGMRAVAPALRGWLTVKDGAFRYAGAPVGAEALAFTARFAPDSLTIPALTARVSGQPVRARLFATRFADPLVQFAVQGNLDLAAIAPLLAPQGTAMSGRAAVDVRGSGRARDPGSIALDGRAQLVNVGVRAKDLPQPIEGVNGFVELSPQRAVVRHLTARAGKSSYTIDASVTRPLALMAAPDKTEPAGVTFDFRSPYLDLAELLPLTPGAPFLPNARGSGRVAIGRLKQGRLDVANVTADVALSPARLESPNFALAAYGGTVTGSTAIDLHDTRRPTYTLKAGVTHVQVNDVLTAWTPARDLVKGVLSTTIDLSGAGQTPEDFRRTLTLVALAAISEGQLGPGPTFDAIAQFVKIPQLREVKFRDLKLPLRVQNGRIVTDPVNLSGSSGDWKLAGAIGFDGALDYAVSVTLSPEISAALSARSALAAGALSDDKGRVLLDLRVSGNARSPRIAWDPRAMQDRLAGRVSAAFADERAKLEAAAKAAALQALADRLGAASDSTRRASAQAQGRAAQDTLRHAADDLIKRLLGGGRKAPARDSTLLPPPPDTTKH